MKKIAFILAALALCIQAQADDHTLSTTDGVTYTGITLQRAEPDGVYIEYALPGGGLGMSKIKFNRLSRTQRYQFGYNRSAARAYQDAVAAANDQTAQELTRWSDTERDARHQRDAENERAYAGRMAEISRLNAARAADFYRDTASSGSIPDASLSFGAGLSTGGASTQRTFSNPSTDVIPNRGVTIRSH